VLGRAPRRFSGSCLFCSALLCHSNTNANAGTDNSGRADYDTNDRTGAKTGLLGIAALICIIGCNLGLNVSADRTGALLVTVLLGLPLTKGMGGGSRSGAYITSRIAGIIIGVSSKLAVLLTADGAGCLALAGSSTAGMRAGVAAARSGANAIGIGVIHLFDQRAAASMLAGVLADIAGDLLNHNVIACVHIGVPIAVFAADLAYCLIAAISLGGGGVCNTVLLVLLDLTILAGCPVLFVIRNETAEIVSNGLYNSFTDVADLIVLGGIIAIYGKVHIAVVQAGIRAYRACTFRPGVTRIAALIAGTASALVPVAVVILTGSDLGKAVSHGIGLIIAVLALGPVSALVIAAYRRMSDRIAIGSSANARGPMALCAILALGILVRNVRCAVSALAAWLFPVKNAAEEVSENE